MSFNKQQYITRDKAIEERYKLLGVDIEKINRELEASGRNLSIATEEIRRQKTFLQRLFWKPFLGLTLDKDVEKRWYELDAKELQKAKKPSGDLE